MVQQAVSATNVSSEAKTEEKMSENKPIDSASPEAGMEGKKFYQNWWFWVIVVVVILGIFGVYYLM